MEMPGRTFSSEQHDFGYQNQMTDEELWGGSVSYKYRMEDPRLGRFFAVDPLAAKYPYNSTYAFSENRVFDARESQGLEVYFIHGTFVGPETWKQNMQSTNNLMNALGTKNAFYPDWDGYNLNANRNREALRIALDIMNARDINSSEPLSIVGHSHGGTVAMLVTNILYATGKEKYYVQNLVTINMPVRSWDLSRIDGWEAKQALVSLSPRAKANIHHYHFAHERDYVVEKFGGGQKLEQSNALFYAPYGDRIRGSRFQQAMSWSGENGPSYPLFSGSMLDGYKHFAQFMLPPPGGYNDTWTGYFGNYGGTVASDNFHNTHQHWDYGYMMLNYSSSVSSFRFNSTTATWDVANPQWINWNTVGKNNGVAKPTK